MFPWRKKGRPFDFYSDNFFGDEFFRDLEDEFREMEDNMTKIFDEARKMAQKKPGEGGLFVYGFSMRVGPDGKPHVEEFGNIPEMKRGISGEGRLGLTHREPLTDIIERDKEISVVAEIPGVEKSDIKLDSTEEALTIDVNTENRKYHKELQLPCKIKPDSAKATYKNGVLEIKLQRVEEKKPEKKGVKVKVD